jgi:hypothetical protein
MSATDFWSPALAPPLAPADVFADLFDDAPDCSSRLYVPAGSLSLGPLSCTVDHRASGLDWLHGTVLAGHSTEWTTGQAATSLAEYLATQGPRCSECERPAVTGGMCGYHRDCELATDDIETPEDAA